MLSLTHGLTFASRAAVASRRTFVSVRAAAADPKAKAAPKAEKITKTELKDIVKSATGLTMADTSRAVDALLDAIVHGVAAGKEVVIPGFGSFKPRERKAREGRNPKTGAAIKIEAKVSPGFTAGKGFKDTVAKGGK